MSETSAAYLDGLTRKERLDKIEAIPEDMQQSQEGPKFISARQFRTPKGEPQGFKPPKRDWKAVAVRMEEHMQRHPYDVATRQDYIRRVKPKADAYKPTERRAQA